MPKNESSGIAAYVNRLVDNRCDLGDIAEVARVCHSLALAILRAKAARGKLHPEFFEFNLSALAYDFIGELFQRDESLQFVQLAHSFERFEGKRIDDDDVLVFLLKIGVCPGGIDSCIRCRCRARPVGQEEGSP